MQSHKSRSWTPARALNPCSPGRSKLPGRLMSHRQTDRQTEAQATGLLGTGLGQEQGPGRREGAVLQICAHGSGIPVPALPTVTTP